MIVINANILSVFAGTALFRLVGFLVKAELMFSFLLIAADICFEVILEAVSLVFNLVIHLSLVLKNQWKICVWYQFS